ncbi:sensor histidine kinase [Streptococcus catagoni]|uniref:sensor histidine kinase n=1 Tax=Streptococcus catagoni TaxID=2654874 RepID=UPI001F28AD94|nr:sensor histidine kinase [Streptococcus catagoni]
MMKYKEKIKQICQEQTDLEERDIDYLVSKADELLMDSAYANDDVFIDVKNVYTADNAIVIFHKKPKTRNSLYEKTVVGAEAYLQNEPGVIRTLQTGMPSIGLSALSQEGVQIYQTVFPILRKQKVIGTLIVETDSTQLSPSFVLKKQLQSDVYEVVEQSLAERFAMLNYVDDVILIFNSEGYLVYHNEMAQEVYCHQLGYLDSIEGMHYDNLVLDNVQFENIWHCYLQESQQYAETEVEYGSYHFLIKRHFIKADNALVMICKDITHLKSVEFQLLTQVTSLREMNHRVKNNLQTVVSLLRLQARQSQSEETQKALVNGVNRILSIASMHDILSSGSDASVSVEILLKKVLENVQRCFLGHLDISVTYDIKTTVFLDSSRATSMALIVNELLQNSYDHAFNQADQKKPQIHLKLDSKAGLTKVSVSDNGSGYNAKGYFSNNHLGLLLVSRFVQSKLQGKLDVHSDSNGTTTTITFKN